MKVAKIDKVARSGYARCVFGNAKQLQSLAGSFLHHFLHGAEGMAADNGVCVYVQCYLHNILTI